METLYVAINLKSERSQNEPSSGYDQLIVSILTLLAVISFMGKDNGFGQSEISGFF